jgi:hypothetical protein
MILCASMLIGQLFLPNFDIKFWTSPKCMSDIWSIMCAYDDGWVCSIEVHETKRVLYSKREVFSLKFIKGKVNYFK